MLRRHDKDHRMHDGKNKKNSHSSGGWDPEIKGSGRLVPPESYGETLGLSAQSSRAALSLHVFI